MNIKTLRQHPFSYAAIFLALGFCAGLALFTVLQPTHTQDAHQSLRWHSSERAPLPVQHAGGQHAVQLVSTQQHWIF